MFVLGPLAKTRQRPSPKASLAALPNNKEEGGRRREEEGGGGEEGGKEGAGLGGGNGAINSSPIDTHAGASAPGVAGTAGTVADLESASKTTL